MSVPTPPTAAELAALPDWKQLLMDRVVARFGPRWFERPEVVGAADWWFGLSRLSMHASLIDECAVVASSLDDPSMIFEGGDKETIEAAVQAALTWLANNPTSEPEAIRLQLRRLQHIYLPLKEAASSRLRARTLATSIFMGHLLPDELSSLPEAELALVLAALREIAEQQ